MSSSQALKAAATGTAVATSNPDKPKSIAGLLTDPAIKAQMALALPKHVTADRLARIALTEVRKVPKLAQCDQTSFLGAIMQCCALGLEPGGALGHCYLIPFENRRQNRTEVQFIVGYRGMIDLARRSGQILSIEARTVHEKDHFEVELGLDSKIVHRPDWNLANRGALTFVYAVAKLKDGGVQFDVMSRAEIEAIRDKSQGYTMAKRYAREGVINSPWATNFEEMAKKTVIRRLFKYLPVSIEIQRAVGLDEQAELGVQQDNPLVIEGSYNQVASDTEADDAANDAPADDGITAAEVIAAIEAAGDLDALDAAADMIRMLPEDQRKDANEAHRTRRVALTTD
jgi:recombination protein RecT